MSRKGMATPGGEKRGTGRRAVIAILIGLAGLLAGMVFGDLLGANIGGNWMTWVDLGSLHGYEATAAVGAAAGGVAGAVLAFWLAWRHR